MFFLIEMPVVSKPTLPGMGNQIFRGGQHGAALQRQFILVPLIVGIQKGEETAFRSLDAAVTSRCGASIGLLKVYRFDVAPGTEISHEITCRIGGTVVDNDDFQRRQTLAL